jgi:toxin ParE1/3/4
LTRYPYLLFFMERDDHIDVWRVLHGKRDIPVWLANDTDPDNLLG